MDGSKEFAENDESNDGISEISGTETIGSNAEEEAFNQAPVCRLNDDCLIYIFERLPVVDHVRIERVCKRWRNLRGLSWFRLKDICLGNIFYDFLDGTKTFRAYSTRLNVFGMHFKALRSKSLYHRKCRNQTGMHSFASSALLSKHSTRCHIHGNAQRFIAFGEKMHQTQEFSGVKHLSRFE